MASSFFITPFDPAAWQDPDDTTEKPTSDLRIDRTDLRDQLLERWPVAVVSTERTEYYSAFWRLPPEAAEYAEFQGRLANNQQVIWFDTGPDQSFLDFILWYRHYVPVNDALHLVHESQWDSLILTANTSEEDIIKFTGIIR